MQTEWQTVQTLIKLLPDLGLHLFVQTCLSENLDHYGCADGLMYYALDVKQNFLSSHIILTPGHQVLALTCKSEHRASSS